ncbi:glycosyltransferase family 2 protein [Candidatus Woesearchaeota archaeon]|nr:glycosyltransferase family 2 protein [Candidatus Woesearchaeota archaeon]
MPTLKISVIGLSYNRKDLLPLFIESIYDSSFDKQEVEIIIVDNASSDGSIEMLKSKYPAVKVIARTSNIGSGAHNDALVIAQGEYLFFSDIDLTFEKGCLEQFYNTANSMGKDIILTPRLYEYNRPNQLAPSYSILSRSFYTVFIRPKDLDSNLNEVFMNGLVFMRRDTAKKLRYIFDNDYFLYSEDFDLCLRIRLQGFKLYNCPKAIMYCRPLSETTTPYLKKKGLVYYMERNYLLTFFKICSLKTLILYAPYVFTMRIIALVKDIITFQPGLFVVRLKAYLWVIPNILLILKKRTETQKERVKSDKEIFAIADEKYFWKSKLGWLK